MSAPGAWLRGLAVAALAGSASWPRAATAQGTTATLDLGGSSVRVSDSLDVSAFSLSPALRFASSRATAGASGSWSQLGGGGWSAQAAADASLLAPLGGPISAELGGTLGGSTHRDGTRTGQALAVARLHLERARVGGWLGAAGGGSWDGLARRATALAEAGVWARAASERGAMTMGATVVPTRVDDSVRFTDMHFVARWDAARLELGATLGARAGARGWFGESGSTWGSVQAVAWVTNRAALVAGAGSYPVDPTQGYPGGRFASLALRIAAARAGREEPVAPVVRAETPRGVRPTTVTPAGSGRRTVRVHAPTARRVELMGDFTGWSPLRMSPAADGWWTVTTDIPRGPHQVNVRVDGGEWRVPPGLATLRDEFGGTVGVLVVP